jgi:hypothetical protein
VESSAFFELWDVSVTRAGKLTIMGGGVDEFCWHPQAGENTKGSWEIRGAARFLPYYDVLEARQRGEPWQQNRGIPGVGRHLFTLPLTQPTFAGWDHFSNETVRILKATWNCFPGDPTQDTDLSGSAPITP